MTLVVCDGIAATRQLAPAGRKVRPASSCKPSSPARNRQRLQRRQRKGAGSGLPFREKNEALTPKERCTDKKVWQEVGTRLGIPPEDCKLHLRLIVERRNKIAHEADMDPTSPGARWPISAQMVQESIQFLDDIAVAIIDTVL